MFRQNAEYLLLFSYQDELLDALTSVHFAGVQVALRVGHDLVHPMKLSRVAAAVSHLTDHRAVFAPYSPDHVVLAVVDKQKFLVFVGGTRKLPDRPDAQSLCTEGELLHEFSLLGENLHAIVDAVTDINEPVLGEVYAMHRVAELLIRRRGWIVWTRINVFWRVAVRSPNALERASF